MLLSILGGGSPGMAAHLGIMLSGIPPLIVVRAATKRITVTAVTPCQGGSILSRTGTLH